MNLSELIEEFHINYAQKQLIPNWFVPLFKTATSRGITIEDWNELVRNNQATVSDVESIKIFIEGFNEYINESLIPDIDEIIQMKEVLKTYLIYIGDLFDLSLGPLQKDWVITWDGSKYATLPPRGSIRYAAEEPEDLRDDDLWIQE